MIWNFTSWINCNLIFYDNYTCHTYRNIFLYQRLYNNIMASTRNFVALSLSDPTSGKWFSKKFVLGPFPLGSVFKVQNLNWHNQLVYSTWFINPLSPNMWSESSDCWLDNPILVAQICQSKTFVWIRICLIG